MRIRSFRDGDPAAIRALHDRTPPAGSPASPMPPPWPSDLNDIPRRFLTFWVAEIDGTIVGMAGLVAVGKGVSEPVLSGIASRKDAVRLTRMRIALEWQRCGIGSRLVETVLSWARDQGRTHVVLETTAEQAAAIALYRRRGFAEVTRSTHDPWELVWMRRAVLPDDQRPGEGFGRAQRVQVGCPVLWRVRMGCGAVAQEPDCVGCASRDAAAGTLHRHLRSNRWAVFTRSLRDRL